VSHAPFLISLVGTRARLDLTTQERQRILSDAVRTINLNPSRADPSSQRISTQNQTVRPHRMASQNAQYP
jgi:hypothetical protein